MGFRYWFSESRGLIRQRDESGSFCYPEVWNGTSWVTGSPYVLDAITGMGEDPWSCGAWADRWSLARAERYAREHGIVLDS
jgi:hypothetical protein